VVICLEQGADLHMAQLMPLPLTVSCFSKIQIGFTFLVQAHPGSPRKRAVKQMCVYTYNVAANCHCNRLSHLKVKTTTTTTPVKRPLFAGHLGKPVPER